MAIMTIPPRISSLSLSLSLSLSRALVQRIEQSQSLTAGHSNLADPDLRTHFIWASDFRLHDYETNAQHGGGSGRSDRRPLRESNYGVFG